MKNSLLNKKRKGSGLIIAMLLLMMLASIAATFLMFSITTSRQVTTATQMKQAMYSSEATIDDAIFKLSTDSSLWWSEFGGKRYAWTWVFFTNTYSWTQIVDYQDAEKTYDIYAYTSYRDIGRTISARVQKIEMILDPTVFESAFSIQINPDSNVNAAGNNIPVVFNGANSFVSSQDHGLDGVAFGPVDKPGMAMNNVIDLGGPVNWGGAEPGQITGDPKTTNTDTYNGLSVKQVVAYAEQVYDSKIDMSNSVDPVWNDDGSPNELYDSGLTFTQNLNGTFGDAGNYKVVFVDATSNGNDTLHFSGDFAGYGLMVVKIKEGESCNIRMSGQSAWTGLIVVDIEEDTTIEGDVVIGNKGVLNLVGGGNNNTHVLGGAAVNIDGDTTWLANSSALTVAGVSGLDYSSAAIMNALTPHKSMPDPVFELKNFNPEITYSWDWGYMFSDESYYSPWATPPDYFTKGSWEDQ